MGRNFHQREQVVKLAIISGYIVYICAINDIMVILHMQINRTHIIRRCMLLHTRERHYHNLMYKIWVHHYHIITFKQVSIHIA